MKTISFKPILILFTLIFSNSYSQNEFNKSTKIERSSKFFNNASVNDFNEDVDLFAFEDTKPLDYFEAQDDARTIESILARTMFAFGAGFGFGEEQTLWCLHAAYYMQLAMLTNSALYGSLGLVYNGLSYNDISSNLIDIQLKLLMFSAITKYKEVFLTYGILAAYGIGSEKYNNFTTNIAAISASMIIGLQVILTSSLSFAVQTSLFTYQKTKYKPENGNDYDVDYTRALINKQNLLSMSLFINLGRQR